MEKGEEKMKNENIPFSYKAFAVPCVLVSIDPIQIEDGKWNGGSKSRIFEGPQTCVGARKAFVVQADFTSMVVRAF